MMRPFAVESKDCTVMLRSRWIRIVLIFALTAILLLVIRLHSAASEVRQDDMYGSPESGLRLAQAWCAECHSIGSKIQEPFSVATDFVEIANLPSTTALSLNAFLRTNHNSMPNFVIEPADAQDIVAYILSLRRE
jgi:mono/diheme cytochrome c family protein